MGAPQTYQFLTVIRDGGGSVDKVDVWAAAAGLRH